jgi:hypothetical protein
VAASIHDGAVNLCQRKTSSWGLRYEKRIEYAFNLGRRDAETSVCHFNQHMITA